MEQMHYIEAEDKLVIQTSYETEAVLEQNRIERNAAPEFGRYKTSRPTGLVKVASFPVEHIEALKNKGYNLLSPDRDEVRRALCYIQEHEPHWLTVPGKPFALHRPQWR
jgi:hypothetical protein